MRQRRWLVEEVEPPANGGDATLVSAACADDDAQGDKAVVLWEHELDACVLDDAGWTRVRRERLDDPALFAA